MAIFIPGMRCVLSGREINSSADAVLFPPFVSNEADPLYIFSDGVVHVEALKAHPLGALAEARATEAVARIAPASRKCLICGHIVIDPDDYLGLGHLVTDAAHLLHEFNYAHFHRSCLRSWPDLSILIRELEELDRSGIWAGDALKWTINALQATQP